FLLVRLSMSPATWAAIISNGLGPRASPQARHCDFLNVRKDGGRTGNRRRGYITFLAVRYGGRSCRCQEFPVSAWPGGVRNVASRAPFGPSFFWASLPLGRACLGCP